MVISNMSLFLKYFICIDAIALDYRVSVAAGFPRDPHRRRSLLGWRHSFEHAGRGGFRRLSEAQWLSVRGPYVESEWSRTENNLGCYGETKGPSVFKSCGKPHCAAKADPQTTSRHLRIGPKAARRNAQNAGCR